MLFGQLTSPLNCEQPQKAQQDAPENKSFNPWLTSGKPSQNPASVSDFYRQKSAAFRGALQPIQSKQEVVEPVKEVV